MYLKLKKLENLKLPFTKVSYNKKDVKKYDCEIEIQFNELSIKDRKYKRNKAFSKEIDKYKNDSVSTFPSTIRGYVHQSIKERKLRWKVVMKTNSDSSNCKSINKVFAEKIISKSINNTVSGNRKAVPRKYRSPIGKELLSKKEVTEKALDNFYKKVTHELKKNH